MSEQKPQSLSEFIQVFFTFGLLAFRDRQDNIDFIRKELVECRKWVSNQSFKYIIEFCDLLPGMQTQKIVTHIGWCLWGIPGGILAGLLYVLPGSIFLLFASMFYANNAASWWCQALFYGLGPATISILLYALLTFVPSSYYPSRIRLLSLFAFSLLYIFGVSFLIVLSISLAYGIVFLKPPASVDDSDDIAEFSDSSTAALHDAPDGALEDVQATAAILEGTLSGLDQLAFTGLLFVFWLTPLIVLIMALEPGHPLVELAFLFFQSILFSFGEAQGIFAYIAEQTVLARFWLEAEHLSQALTLAEALPGPPLLALQYIGFIIGHSFATAGPLSFLDPNVAGLVGAFLGFWVTAIPGFLWILTLAPNSISVRFNPLYHAMSNSIKAMLFGACAYFTMWLGLRILFEYSTEINFGPIQLELPLLHTLDFNAAVIAIVACYIRMYLKQTNTSVVYICVPLGFLMQCLDKYSIY